MPATPCLQDASFGPVSTCRTFDFTLLFESAVLSILPSALFILLALLLLYDLLLRKPTRVLTPLRYLPQLGKQLIAWKIAFSGGAIVCDAIALAAWVSRAGRADATPGFSATTASLALRLTAALLTAPVAYLEFFRRLQGSPLLPLGLLIFTLCDAARIRTFGFFSLGASPSDSLFFGTFVAGVACRVALWILETAPKGAFVERAEGDKAITSEETSSFFARLLITSVDPLLWRGFRTTLTIQSLGSIHSRYDAERLYSAGIDHWRILSKDGRTKHPLFRTMFKAFGSTLVAPVLPCVIYSLAQITQPTLVSDVITFVESYQTGNAADQQPVQNGYGLIAAYFLVFAISTLSWSLFQMSALRSAVAVRGFLVQMIYRKALLIHQDVAKEIGTGSSTSLMSVDVERMVTQLEPFHLLYSSFIIVTVGLVILYYTVGIAFVATIIVAVLFIASVPIATRSIPKHQRAWSGRTDLRVKLLNSVIRNIKAVKLSGYEELLIRKLEAFRNYELEKQAAYLWRILAVSLYSNSLRSALSIATLVTYTIISQHSEAHAVDTATFFTAISVLAVVSDPLLIVAQRFGAIMAATASLARIQEFLLKEERQDTRLDAGENGSISGEGLSLGTKDLALLRDMTFALPRGSLTMVVGTVGSGKTTFLHGLMGEVDGTQGILRFPKAMSVGFCAQDAFLRPGDTIRQNIQFLSPAQPALYRAVVKACALDIDFKVWPQGDKQKAQGLSGGQRQRIALARALYARPDILVLDDIFSALDKTTEEHVFQALFGLGGLLVGKTVVLSTNAVHRLPNADQILLLENNTIGQQGTFAELSENPGAVRDLLTLVKETREHDQDVSREPGAAAAMGHAGEDAASSYLASLNLANTVDEIEEEMAAERSKRSPIKVFMTAGGLISFAIMILLLTVAPAASAVVPIYVQAWTSAIRSDQSQIYTYLGGYVALEFCAALLLGLGLYYIFLVYVRRSSRRLHGKEVRAILRTSLSYFDSVPIGRILSRFSQDLFVIDFELGNYFCNFWALLIEMLVTCVVLTVAAPYVGIAVAFTFILCIAIQRFYLRTSRQVRRMDFIAKSPLYTLFAETVDVNGLRTFRAARAEDSLAGLAVAKGNTSQVPYYYMNGVKKWLNLVLGGVTTGINTILVTVAVIQRANTSSGLLAVALVQAVQLTFFLNHTIVSLADFETALVALSRIQEVIELPPEEVVGPDGKSHAPVGGIDYSEDVDDEDKDVGIPLKQKGKADEWDWITAGSVRFQNVVLKYRPELPPALKNLSFKVPGGQKVGIVGRSGCGKSTALQALFRMVECESGSIYIDGVDIRSMPRTMLRSAMTIIPQDPLLLELSIRENLDLEGTCSDQELWAALEQTQCKSLVEALPEKLETLVSGDGGDFSRGERQLLALARALLRKRKILVLDEASSSLDIASDARMQEVLRRAFDRCTIITVAHRLNTLLDYDEIIVLSAGELVEQGNPQRLLRESPNGPFSQLVRGEQAAVEGEEAQEDLDIIRELA